MATSLLPELSNPNIAGDVILGKGGVNATGLQVRRRCEQRRIVLETERASFLSQWRELSNYIKPRRGRFTVTDVNKGDRRWQHIIDSTGTESAGILESGLMSGVTNPAKPWFRLTTPDEQLNEQGDVKEWLHEVTERIQTVLLRSNFYQIIPTLFGDMGVFGTGAMGIFDDPETIIRCYDFPVGTYALATDDKRRVRVFLRTYRLTVEQIVDQWGEIDPKTGFPNFMDDRDTTISTAVQQMWKRDNLGAWIDLVHLVQPNVSYDGSKIDARYKQYESIYYELGTPNKSASDDMLGLLQHSGFDEFPIITGRWDTNSEDVYGTDCPGMRALGDIKQLQLMERRGAQAIEKTINPPLTGPSHLQNTTISALPGAVTYADARDQQSGLRPLYQINFSIQELEEKEEQIRQRIKSAFKVDLFLQMLQAEPQQRTATEVEERSSETVIALGRTYWQMSQDVLDPSIDRVFAIMARKQLIPPAPQALQGMALKVEYISTIAQALKQVGIQGLERTAAFVGQLTEGGFPEAADNIDVDELIRVYADDTGVPPKVVRDDAAVQQIRDQRQQQQQQQQMAANLPGIAGAAKDLKDSGVLQTLLAKRGANATLNATASPVSSAA